jgi:hypothetical protein
LAAGVVVQREHGPVAYGVTRGAGRLDGSPVSEASGLGGGVQFGQGSVALRSGGRQFGPDERRRPGRGRRRLGRGRRHPGRAWVRPGDRNLHRGRS